MTPQSNSESNIPEVIILSSTNDGSQSNSQGETVNYRTSYPAIEGYEIVRELGRGAMGVVYEAQQLTVGRRVALKTLTALTNDSHRERFQTEVEAIAQLQHPNIVQLFEF